MSKPIIAVTPRIAPEDNHSWVQDTYLSCIRAAGGIPVLLPHTGEDPLSLEDFAGLVTRFDGLLFTGGPDLHPGLFGEEPMPLCGEISAERDSLEIPLMQEAIRQNKPILGICRGMQTMNVALGGSLYQDIPSQLPASRLTHCQEEPYQALVHKINVIKGTPLYTLLLDDQIMVNSIHHQSVKKLAPDLHAMAKADDGVIEALYHIKRDFAMGFQWHPEWLGMQTTETEKIFCAFLDACQNKA